MNGLKISNSWTGYLVLLNPPYTAAAQWRFVNRAIDEVENDRVRHANNAINHEGLASMGIGFAHQAISKGMDWKLDL